MNPARRSTCLRRLGAVLALMVLTVPAAPSRAQAPAASAPAAALEPMPPTTFVAKLEVVPIFAEPGFVYRQVGRLSAGQLVEVDGRRGDWLRVRGGGWVNAAQLMTQAEAAAAPKAGTPLVVVKEGARVRASASTDSPVIDTLPADRVVTAVGESGGWWELTTGGFISASLVRAEGASPLAAAAARASTPERPLPWVVGADSANVRSGRGTEFGVVRRLVRGDIVAVTSVEDGWAQVEGGWVRQDLLHPPAPAAASIPAAAASAQAPVQRPRRWSLMDLSGTLIQVTEISDAGMVANIRAAMREPDVLEADWTMLGITIAVSRDAELAFNYSPDVNATHVRDASGQVYGNVYARGPLSRLPADIRRLLDSRAVEPGERYDGVLLFRPTLRVQDIRDVLFDFQGRTQRLLPEG